MQAQTAAKTFGLTINSEVPGGFWNDKFFRVTVKKNVLEWFVRRRGG
jgi:hypothetical protein